MLLVMLRGLILSKWSHTNQTDAVMLCYPETDDISDPASMPALLDADEEGLLNKYLASRFSGLYYLHCFTPECITR